MAEDLVGTVVDDWKIAGKIGEGAMGAVYEASRGGQVAAVKVALPRTLSKKALERFRREANILMEIRHPNVIRCYQAGESDDFVYLALEFLEGGTLQDLLEERGPLSVPQAVGVTCQILSGLDAIHAHGIVHRDIKPDNVLLDSCGTPKLGDFSMARAEKHAKITTTGTILGTLDYMAPEQSREEEVDRRADLYATGAMLYHLVAGKPPYEGRSGLAVLQQHINAPLPDVTQIPGGDALQPVIQALMAKAPEDRPADAQAALALLDGLPQAPLMNQGAARRPPTPRPDAVVGPGPAAATRPGGVALDGAAVLVCVLVALYGVDRALSGRAPEATGGLDALRLALDAWLPLWLPPACLLGIERVAARLTGRALFGLLGQGGGGPAT